MNYAQRNMLPFRKKQSFSVTLVALIAVSCVCDFAAAIDSPTIEEDRMKIFDNDNDAKQEILNLVAKEEAQIKNDELKDTPDDANSTNFNEELINMNSTEPFIFNLPLNSSLENSTASETIEETFNKSNEETVSHSEEDQEKIKEKEFDHFEDLPVTNVSEEPVESEKINFLERNQSNETGEERFSITATPPVISPQSDLPVTEAEQNNSTSLWEILINKVVPPQSENLETGDSTELVDNVIQNLPVVDEEENNQAPSTLDQSEVINNSSTFENSTLPAKEMPITDEQVQLPSESFNAENKTILEVPSNFAPPDYFSHRLFLPSLAMSGVTEIPPPRNFEESDSAEPSSTNEKNTFENSEDSVVLKNSTNTEHLEEPTFNSEEAGDDRISNDESNIPALDNTPYLDSNSEETEEIARSTTANEPEGNSEESTRVPIHGDSEDEHRTESAKGGVEIPHLIDENEPSGDNSNGTLNNTTFLNNSGDITDEIPVPTQSEESVAETEIPKTPSTYGLFFETSNSTVQEEPESSNETMAPLLKEESVRSPENQESNENTLRQNHSQKEIQRHIPAFWRRRLFPESFEGQFQPPLTEEKHEIQNLSAKDFVPENTYNLPIEKTETYISNESVLSEIKDQQESGIPTSPVPFEENEGETNNESATTDFHSTIENEQSEGYGNQEGPNLDNTNTSNEENSVGTPQSFTADLQNYPLNMTMEAQSTSVNLNNSTEHDQFSNNNDYVHDDNKTHPNSELHPENVTRPESLFSTVINNQENNYSKDSFEEKQAGNEQDNKFPIEKEINQFTSSPIEITESHTSKLPGHQTDAINDISRTHVEESKPVNSEVETNQPEKQEFTNEIIPEFSKQYHPETNIMRLPRSYAPEEEAELKRQISDIIENIKSPWTLKMIRDMLTEEIHELHQNTSEDIKSEDSFKEERSPIDNEAKRFTIHELQKFNQPSKNNLIPSDVQEGPEDEQLGHKNEEVTTENNSSSTTNTMGEAKTPWEEVTEEYRKYQMLHNQGNKTDDSSTPSAEAHVSTDKDSNVEHVQSEKLENKSVFGSWMSSISSFLGLS